MKILGISGKARHGKDLCANLIREIALQEFGIHIMSFGFADPLKARVFGEAAGKWSFEEVFHDKPPEVRTLLQVTGTEEGRDIYGEDFWTLQAEAYLRIFEERLPFLAGAVFSDVRFPNEVAFVRANGHAAPSVKKSVWAVVEDDIRHIECAQNERAHLKLQAYKHYMRVYLEENQGCALWIQSDRPTLQGEAARHLSETALDQLDPELDFDGVIVNNVDTTIDDLRVQLRPWVEVVAKGGVK